VTAVARERIAALLGEVTSPGSFSARRAASVDDLHLEVRGLGQLLLPVPDAQAKQLCRLGRPARYGRGEQTLLDPRVRDTWEIPKSRVKIDKRRWNNTLLPVLEGLRGDLGLPSGCQLEAELHSMLVYARGQFFVPHQDSEKADEMVGSLVVMLPTSFTGGALVVEHAGETATYRGSGKSLSFVAFYADCRHAIRPVRSGYRIVLTYNLLLREDTVDAITTEAAPEAVAAVARCVEEHFATPLPSPSRSAGEALTDPPNRLVYLLDHEYTMRGLSWSRLKGSDASRAAVLRAAATRTGCEVVLALADVHETWSCLGAEWDAPWYGRPRGGWRDGWNDDLDDEDAWAAEEGPTERDGYELEELVDWSITLDAWIDPKGVRGEPVATPVRDVEVCATTASVDLRPYASEYEGYMGNYGNTMDRWYRRGALVLWPRDRDFVVRAEASPTWALDALTKQLRAGDVAAAREMAAALSPFWITVAGHEQRRGFLTAALRVARGLDHPERAAMLLAPFRVEMLGRSHARGLAALVERYGQTWARDLLAAWFGRGRPGIASGGKGREAWVASLAGLCEALHATGGTGAATARLLIEGTWSWLSGAVEQRRGLMPPSRRAQALGELTQPILAVLESTATIAAADLRDEVVGSLCCQSDDLLACLMQVLRAAGTSPTTRPATGLDRIAQHCTERVRARLARPPRADDDWSIEPPGGCDCTDCDVLGGFLTDPARRSFEWPLAKERRRHVHTRLDGAELPVRHQTRRTGRPYTLVLTKTQDLFDRDMQIRRRDEADLTWLHGTWGRV
jgi:hypothetical protein